MEILNKYFPAFNFVNVSNRLCLEGWMITNAKNNYKIRLYVPSDLPYSVPDAVIIYPNPLTDYYGRTLLESSAVMHLLSPVDGYPKICTYKTSNWNSSITFYKLLVKIRIWLEAFDGHISTGNNLDFYLKHQL
jgi:hypothetical protein